MSDRAEALRQIALLHRNEAKRLLASHDRSIQDGLAAIAHATLAMEAQIERTTFVRNDRQDHSVDVDMADGSGTDPAFGGDQ